MGARSTVVAAGLPFVAALRLRRAPMLLASDSPLQRWVLCRQRGAQCVTLQLLSGWKSGTNPLPTTTPPDRPPAVAAMMKGVALLVLLGLAGVTAQTNAPLLDAVTGNPQLSLLAGAIQSVRTPARWPAAEAASSVDSF